MPQTYPLHPVGLFAVDGTLFFSARDNPAELSSDYNGFWKSDGTNAGTVELLSTGGIESMPFDVGGTVFFQTSSDRSVWKTNGTAAGTTEVSGPVNSADVNTTFKFLNNTLFFAGGSQLSIMDTVSGATTLVTDTLPGVEAFGILNGRVLIATNGGLWESDGTSAGTQFISPASFPFAGSDIVDPSENRSAVVGGKLFFGTLANSLYVTDGTSAGTHEVAAIAAHYMTAANGHVVFGDFNGTVWTTDGTSAGTLPIAATSIDRASDIVSTGNEAFFIGHDLAQTTALWESDGTVAGTHVLKTFGPSTAFAQQMVAVNGTVLFEAFDTQLHQWDLWASDGTSSGTRPIFDVGPDDSGGDFASLNGTLYFTADDIGDRQNTSIWATNGTAAGTHLAVGKPVSIPIPGTQPDDGQYLTSVGGTLFLTADDGLTSYRELWQSNGTSGGTTELTHDLTQIGALTASHGTLFFAATDSVHGSELWMATANGAALVADIVPGAGGSTPSDLTDAAGTLFFAATGGLWRSDGTSAGTRLVDAFAADATGTGVTNITAIGNHVFFSADDGTHGRELWVSDGTSAGTSMVADIAPGAASAAPSGLVDVGGTLFFTADDGVDGRQVWKTDGTAAGTVEVTQGLTPTSPIVAMGGTIFFGANNELWRSDGTAAIAITPGYIHERTYFGYTQGVKLQPTVVGGTLFFAADFGQGPELFATDGTATGVHQLTHLSSFPGTYLDAPGPLELTAVGNKLFFSTIDTASHFGQSIGAVWVSDGTAAGTTELVGGLGPVRSLANVNGTLFFATGPDTQYLTHGQLWKSDGTQAGTVLVSSATATPPVAAAPAAASVIDGTPTAIPGITISDPSGVTTGFTVTVAGSGGTLGLGSSAAGTSSVAASVDHATLTITGSLADVNADLSALTFTGGGIGTGSVTVTVNDGQLTSVPATETISVTDAPPVVISGDFESVTSSRTVAIPGIAISDFDTVGETFTVTLAGSGGTVSIPGATGMAGNGTANVVLGGPFAAVNAELASVAFTGTSAGIGSIAVTASDGVSTSGAAQITAVYVAGSGSGSFDLGLVPGNNSISAGGGNDTITFGAGNDTVTAGNGDNVATFPAGATGQSSLSAGNGSDTVIAAGGTNTITLKNGADSVSIAGGAQTLTLGNGADTVAVSGGTNSLTLGNNNLVVVSGGTNTIALSNNDTIRAASGSGTTTLVGFDPHHDTLAIVHTINGNNFANAGQIATSHDASGNLVLDLGPGGATSDTVVLVGISTFSASLVTLI